MWPIRLSWRESNLLGGKGRVMCIKDGQCIRKLWYIYTVEYYSALKRNTFESVLMRWMNLEPIIEGRESEKERQILYIDTYIWNLERRYQRSYMQGSKGDTDVKNRLLDSVGEDKGGMFWENSIETCTLPYVKQMTSASLVHEAGYPGTTQRDMVGRKVGVGFRMGGHMYTHGWFISMYCKNHHNIVSILQLK